MDYTTIIGLVGAAATIVTVFLAPFLKYLKKAHEQKVLARLEQEGQSESIKIMAEKIGQLIIKSEVTNKKLEEFLKDYDIFTIQNYKYMINDKRSEIYTKLPSDLSDYKEELNLTNQGSVDDLINAFQLFLERQKHMKPINTKITKKEFSVEERIVSIRNVLKEKKKIEFFELFDDLSKSYVVVTFLSVLEMTKNKEVIIIQENSFSPLIIEMK